MGRADKVFATYDKEVEAANKPENSTGGLTDQSLQKFEERLTHNMADKLDKIRDQIQGMVDQKINTALNGRTSNTADNQQTAGEAPEQTQGGNENV